MGGLLDPYFKFSTHGVVTQLDIVNKALTDTPLIASRFTAHTLVTILIKLISCLVLIETNKQTVCVCACVCVKTRKDDNIVKNRSEDDSNLMTYHQVFGDI